MSADNGVYIAEFTNEDGSKEYRIAHAQAIDNCFPLDSHPCGPKAADLDAKCSIVLYFSGSEAYTDQREARLDAFELAEKYDFLEYGISEIHFDFPFPDMTQAEAREQELRIRSMYMEQVGPHAWQRREKPEIMT